MRNTLRRVVKFDGEDDPKATLQDLLDKLRDMYNVPFDVNEQAFRFENPDQDVLKTEIATLPLPPITGTLDTVLRKILGRIKVQSGATYLIRKDCIEITTGQVFWAETGPDPRGPRASSPAPDRPRWQLS